MVIPGSSVLLTEQRELVAGQRLGIYTNQTGVLPGWASTVDALDGIADVRAIFSPEHGLYGAAAAGEHVAGGRHPSGAPIYSLYGERQQPLPEQLAGLDALVCDIQDVGCRFYTYVWTLVKLMEAAARQQLAVIVADRPNPLGNKIDGPSLEQSQRSLVGDYDVPILHGLTVGELARLLHAEQQLSCPLTVVPCVGWQRDQLWSATGLPWVPPSPNLPTPKTALVYGGACLLEGANVSVGRGTAKPFELIGAPWIDGVALTAALNASELPGVRWRPVQFQPCAAPYTGEVCGGVQLHVVDSSALRPVQTGLELVATLYQLYVSHWVWNTIHFDRLIGSALVRELIEQGRPVSAITARWDDVAADFTKRCETVRLYA